MADIAREARSSEEDGARRMENEGGHVPIPESRSGETVDLARYGIVSVPATIFEWGGYRYTNAHDAIAAAKRAEKR